MSERVGTDERGQEHTPKDRDGSGFWIHEGGKTKTGSSL